MGNQTSSNKKETLPIDTIFSLPANIPVWPQGAHFLPFLLDFIVCFLMFISNVFTPSTPFNKKIFAYRKKKVFSYELQHYM